MRARLLLTTGACSGTSPRQKPEPQAPAYPAVFGDPAAQPGPGTHRELCSLWERTGPPRTVSVNLPDGFVERSTGREGCTFEARIGNGAQIDLHPESSLASYLRRKIEPNVDVGGDVSFSNVKYAADVPVSATSEVSTSRTRPTSTVSRPTPTSFRPAACGCRGTP